MKYTISFQERAKLGMQQLAKQKPVTLKIACEQARKLKIFRSNYAGRKGPGISSRTSSPLQRNRHVLLLQLEE